jgi:hypothetical protein
MAFLPIHKGRGTAKAVVGKALVDDDLLPQLQSLELRYEGRYPYARITTRAGVKEKKHLHYIVWVNNDLNDNRLENLAVVDGSTKNANAPRRSDSSTGYKGVQKQGAKYRPKIGYAGEQLYLGSYDRASDAAYAVNCAYQILRPDVPPPNQIPPRELTTSRMQEIEENVTRLLHPRRPPRKRAAD